MHDRIWTNCTACSLGVQRAGRVIVGPGRYRITPPVVLGEGEGRGVMFVGDPVGEPEEYDGSVFRNSIYQPVWDAVGVLRKAGVPVFLTHSLACRPCLPALNPDGEQRRDPRTLLPMWRDAGMAPKPALDTCRQRLHQEVYRADPRILVALGPEALKALTGKHHSVDDRGKLFTVHIPGRSRVPLLTPKGVWERKMRGPDGRMTLQRPTAPLQVAYSVYLTGKLRDVQTYHASEDPDRERKVFEKDMLQVVKIWKLLRQLEET